VGGLTDGLPHLNEVLLPAHLDGTAVQSLAQARALADAAIKLPDVAVSGRPTQIVVWSLRHPTVAVTPRLASRERSRIAIGVIYANGVVLVAAPPPDPYPSSAGLQDLEQQRAQERGLAFDHLGSLWRGGLFHPGTGPGWWPFFDGRPHTGELKTVNGLRMYVQQSGTSYAPGHSDATWAVPSTVSWIEGGITYRLSHATLPVARLVRMAASVR